MDFAPSPLTADLSQPAPRPADGPGRVPRGAAAHLEPMKHGARR
jgi:hypothetical protein